MSVLGTRNTSDALTSVDPILWIFHSHSLVFRVTPACRYVVVLLLAVNHAFVFLLERPRLAKVLRARLSESPHVRPL